MNIDGLSGQVSSFQPGTFSHTSPFPSGRHEPPSNLAQDSFQQENQPARTGLLKKTRSAGDPGTSAPCPSRKEGVAFIVKIEDDRVSPVSTKIPVDNPAAIQRFTGKRGEECISFTSGGSVVLNIATLNGDVITQAQVPPEGSGGHSGRWEDIIHHRMIRQFHCTPDGLVLRTGTALHLLDPGTGSPEARYPLEGFNLKRAFLSCENGDTLLATSKKLITLDRGLAEKKSIHIGMEADRLERLNDGSLALQDSSFCGTLLLLDSRGETLLRESCRSSQPPFLPDGRLLFLTQASKDEEVTTDLVCYEPSKGAITRFPVAAEADAVFPLAGGGFLVRENRLAEPRLIAYSPEGRPAWNVSFGGKGFIRELYFAPDGASLCFTFDPDSNSKPWRSERQLFRLDLREGASPFFQRRDGKAREPELLYSAKDDRSEYLPALLNNGGILIFNQNTIKLLDGKGKEKKLFKTLQELENGLPQGTFIDSHEGGIFPSHDIPPYINLKKVIGDAAVMLESRAGSGLPLSPELEAQLQLGYTSVDRTLNFSGPGAEEAALAALGPVNTKELDTLNREGTLQRITAHGPSCLPFPGKAAFARSLTLSGETMVISPLDTGSNDTKRTLRAGASWAFTAALPFSTGSRDYVCASESSGMIRLYDAETTQELQAYNFGREVTGITVTGERRVSVVAPDGTALVFSPPMAAGESLSCDPALIPTASGLNPAAESVDENDQYLIIDGIKMQKNPH